MKSREEQDPKVLKQKEALYERIMKSVATEVKKILNENVVTDIIGKKIKEIIYKYFEKEARKDFYAGYLDTPREYDDHVEWVKRNYWSEGKDYLYNHVFRLISDQYDSLTYQDVENYIKKDIGISIDDIIEEAYSDVYDELHEEDEY